MLDPIGASSAIYRKEAVRGGVLSIPVLSFLLAPTFAQERPGTDLKKLSADHQVRAVEYCALRAILASTIFA
jgi:hypothetical protein